MREPTLTIILIVDVEKDPELTAFFFYALRKWNRRAMKRVQVIVITQKQRDPETHRIAARQPFPVDVVHARHETVDSYPLWDVCQEVRQVWGMVRGEYVTFAHQEFLTCPERLEKTLDYLEMIEPTLALGNLMRLGQPKYGEFHVYDRAKERSDEITDKLRRDAGYPAMAAAETSLTTRWLYWMPDKGPGTCEFQEDIFFVKRQWLQDVRLFWQEERLVFQDIYDLMSTACERLGRVGLAPDCIRLDEETHRAIHLWHPSNFNSFTPQIRDWFFAHPDRWEGTNYLRMDLWDRMIGHDPSPGYMVDDRALFAFRRGRGGTVARFAQAIDRWTRTPVGMARIARLGA